MFFEAIKYSAKSSVPRAGAAAPLPGALIVWAGLRLMGYQIAAAETWVQGIAAFILCAGAAWFIIFVGRFLYWPYRELRIARRKLVAAAAASRAHLGRLIAYGRPDLVIPWNENAPQFQGYNVEVQNVSNDTITARVMFLNADVDGTQIMATSAPSPPVIIPQTQRTIFQVRRTENQPISLDANTIPVEFEVDYDTIPESGIRRSYKKIAWHLNWANGKNSAPLVEPRTVDEWER